MAVAYSREVDQCSDSCTNMMRGHVTIAFKEHSGRGRGEGGKKERRGEEGEGEGEGEEEVVMDVCKRDRDSYNVVQVDVNMPRSAGSK